MKTSYICVSTLCFAILIAGCAEDALRLQDENTAAQIPISLSAAYPTATRASDDGFEDGDRMGVYVLDYLEGEKQDIEANDVHAADVRFEFNGKDNSWKARNPLYWTSKDTPADIIAYYPFKENITSPKEFPFSISRRQDLSGDENELGGYEASDFLWAKSEKVMPVDSKVNLTLRHLMAGVRVTLKEGSGFGDGEWASLSKVVLIPNIKPSTNINLENGTLGDAYGDDISVASYKYGDDWRAVVVPQNVEAGKNVIDISVDGVGYHLVKESPVEYVGGRLCSFTIEVNKRGDSGVLEFVLVDEAIIPWIDDVDFRDGIVRNYLVVDVDQRGTLKEIINGLGISTATIINIKLTGEIDNDDFKFLNDECPALQSLNLSDVTIKAKVKEWNENTGSGEEHLRDNEIPDRVFLNKTTLKHVVFPKSLRKIHFGAFYNTGLTGSLVIPEGVEALGDEYYDDVGCFQRCKFLVGELSLPSTLKVIGRDTFSDTSFSGTLNIPENVSFIGDCAFEYNYFLSGDLIIPQNVKFIGKETFKGIPFSGKLVLPYDLVSIGDEAFKNCKFTGVISLPEGVRSIGDEAFLGCCFSGELMLPSSLEHIGEKAFSATKISSVVFHDNIRSIGAVAFLNCKYLRGTLQLPKKMQRVSDYLFFGCSQISEVIIPEDVLIVGSGFVYGCNSLGNIVCKCAQPPLVRYCNLENLKNKKDDFWKNFWDDLSDVASFDGLSKINITLQVPEESVDLYHRAEGWKEFGKISMASDFICRPATACALNSEHSETIILNSSGQWEVSEIPEWCSLSMMEGNLKKELKLTIKELPKGSGNREGNIVFRLKGSDITSECKVSQYDYEYDENQCLTLQKAECDGTGIDILFLGDGWDAEAIADGSYLNLVREQMEDFFGIEPYTTYRNRFNVYACISLSQENGVNTTSTWRNTIFKTFYSHGLGTLQLEDIDAVFDYAIKNSPLSSERMSESLVILTPNSSEYGSATMMTKEGSAVSICCSSPDNYPMDTRGIIQHEACGHGFGKLAEERITKGAFINSHAKGEIESAQWRGWYQNISLTGKLSDVNWNFLIFDPRYSDSVDIFEGAYEYSRGVYRAEINSCMNYGIPYFSAPARLDIMRRILEYSGESFTIEKFYETDSDKWGSTGTTRAAMPNPGNAYVGSGLHHPVRIVKSKKY